MSISYHGIVGYGKSTLPSVESWSTNMNILRDPPKSITTRKIDKVGETSEITEMIQDSGDRTCEAIQVYARGVNPMVSVSYDNSSNNGGQSQYGRATNSKQSFLPYRVMRDGAFRPPIRDQRDLLPLSRLPRVWTSSFTQPGFADFSKKAMVYLSDEDTKGVKKSGQLLQACVRPTATYKIQTPVTEPFEVRYVIKNPITIEANSGIKSRNIKNTEIGSIKTGIIEEPNKIQLNFNKGNSSMNVKINTNVHTDKYIQDKLQGEYDSKKSRNVQVTSVEDLYNVDTDKYIQDKLQGEYDSKKSRNVQVTSIEDLYNVDTDKYIQNQVNINYSVPQKGYDKYDYIHSDIELEKTLPNYDTRTNNGYNIHKRLEGQINAKQYTLNRPNTIGYTNNALQRGGGEGENSRTYNLRPTINPGGMESVPSMPTFERNAGMTEFDTEKTRLRNRIYDMQQERNISLGNVPYIESVR
jgi:hypothetical protein